jgi:glycine/D-amino acid oxidase-like deaminating enzyme
MPDGSDEYEVGILGAGAVGCAIAYHLARRKITPIVLDQEGPGGSAATSGRIWVQADTPESYTRLCLRSIERYPVLEEEIGPVEYVRSGGLAPAFTDAGARAGMDLAQRRAAAGVDVRWLPREEVLHLEPSLSPEILGATFSPYDGSVNPSLLTRRLMRATRQIGGTFLLHCGHLMVRSRPGGFLIRSGRGEIQTGRVVLTTGLDDPDLRRQAEIALPTHRAHEVMLITEALPPLLRHVLTSARQKVSGEMVLESSAQDADGLPGEVMRAAIQRVARDAARLLPSLVTARVIRACAGLRTIPSDGGLILGPAGDNIYVAVASQEITLCPLIGEAIAEVITRRRLPQDLEACGLERFWTRAGPAGARDLRQDSD